MNSETKTCQNCKSSFEIQPEDFKFYEKINVLAPIECFHCRNRKRLAFWPFGKFHRRKSDLSGEDIITIFPPNAKFPVYKTSEWNSDDWQPPRMVYDSGRPFFDQLRELQNKTPHPHQFGSNNLNCDYSDDVWESKNCYLSRSIANCEDISYSYRIIRCRDSYELTYCYDTEQSYDCSYCFKTYNVKYAFDVRDSFDSAFLYDCRNVSDCFMCWNLRGKKFHILNKPYSEEEYYKEIKKYKLTSWEEVEKIKKEFEKQVRENAIHRENINTKTFNSVGNFLTECKKCINSYFLESSENCRNIFRGLENKDSYDSSGIWRGELVYEIIQLTQGYKLKYSIFCTNCSDSEYLDFCNDCENCFGCVGLKKKQYCILNKQYTKEEYEKLVSEIKENMKKDGTFGKFFPPEMAYVGYNLSFGYFLYPLSKDEVEASGGTWEELEKAETKNININEYIDNVNTAAEEIIYKGFICAETGRPFNIRKEELDFYKKHEVPLPRTYPDVRTSKRIKQLFLIKPFPVKCFFCGKEIVSYYPTEFNYKKIACESCYLKEVV